jgi:hypothetical protein
LPLKLEEKAVSFSVLPVLMPQTAMQTGILRRAGLVMPSALTVVIFACQRI